MKNKAKKILSLLSAAAMLWSCVPGVWAEDIDILSFIPHTQNADEIVFEDSLAQEKPTITKTLPGDGQVGLNWTAVSGAAQYAVYYKGTGGWVSAGTTTALGKYVKGLTNGTRYAFIVKAYVNGAWVASDTVYATPAAASVKPVITKAVAGDGQIALNWTAVSGATQYAVYYKGGSSWVSAGTTTALGKYVKGLTNGTKYAFIVKAYVNGAWVASDIVYASTVGASKPKITKAVAGDGQVGLNWTAVSGATQYAVYYKYNGKWTNAGTTTGLGMYVRKLTGGTTYGFAVKAYVNGAWTGISSSDIVYVTLYNSNTATVNFSSGIYVYDIDSATFLISGNVISNNHRLSIMADIDDYINHKITVNGTEYDAYLNGDCNRYYFIYEMDGNEKTLNIDLPYSQWSSNELADIVTLNADDNIRVYYYNSYYNCLGSMTPIENGGHLVKGTGFCIRIAKEYMASDSLITVNGKEVYGAVNADGDYQVWGLTVPDDSDTLKVSIKKNISGAVVNYPSGVWVYDGTAGSYHSNGSIIPSGHEIYVHVNIENYINHKVTVNGTAYTAQLTGDGWHYIFAYTINGGVSTVNIALPYSQWSSSELAKLVTLNADENIRVYYYNSYYGCISDMTPIENGGHLVKGEGFCIRIAKEYLTENSVITVNGQEVSGAVNNDGDYQIWGLTVPSDLDTLRIEIK